METDDLIRAMAAPLIEELHEACRAVHRHFEGAIARGFSPDDSTSTEDCALLYLLVRHFRRTRAFEVGTYIGATAVALNLAARRNEGVLTTCDPIDYGALSPWSGIRFIKGTVEVALAVLAAEGHQVDFVFFDCPPSEAAIAALNRIATPDAVLATHDYGNNPKGERTVELLKGYRVIDEGRWFLPGPAPVEIGPNLRVNWCTAFFVPARLLGAAEPEAGVIAEDVSI